jgi:hypothetical protein
MSFSSTYELQGADRSGLCPQVSLLISFFHGPLVFPSVSCSPGIMSAFVRIKKSSIIVIETLISPNNYARALVYRSSFG